MSLDLETKQYIQQLEEAVNINDQADILHFLYNTKYVNKQLMLQIQHF